MVPSNATAQLSGKGEITGTVADSTGAVISGATVTATNTATGITTKTTSTSAGAFNFSNLDPGVYVVTTMAKNFEKLTQQNVHVNAMESQVYNPVLTVGGADIQITVTAEPPQLETSNATLGATMENEVYSELPIEMGAYGNADQRRATDFVYLMPGIQGNETNGNATTNVGVVNGSGSKGAASAVYIDGVVFVRAGGNGDPRFVWTAMSVDAIDQFQVQTNGYSAVYEGQGVMNYTVKQGGAKQHGSAYEFLRNTALDSWGWFRVNDPVTGLPSKPIEHSNEYGIDLGGPLLPFGKWKQKLFYFANYNGYRYSSATPTPMTFPNALEQAGNFTATGTYNSDPTKGTVDTPIYDPTTQAACTAHQSKGYPCRYQYGYQWSGVGTSSTGAPAPIGSGSPINVIPSSQIPAYVTNMMNLLPSGIGPGLQNNYIAPNPTGLVNWSTTDRIDYMVNDRDTLSILAAIGRQASSSPVGQNTSGRNVGPVPFNWGQAYAPKTAVGLIEETHVFTPHLINQAKWGYARYNGPTFNPDQQPAYSASKMGLANLPAGQATETFPNVTFTGTNAPTNWGGQVANVIIAENYTALDNIQWTVGKHSFTFGGQIAWMLYNSMSATGGTSPLILANAVSETSGLTGSSPTAFTNQPGTGLAYASFLLGQIDKGSLTDYSSHPEYGARFRPISPYIQDNWKVSPKLTLDLGLRWDYFPSVREVNNAASFFDPNLSNSVTGLQGGLNFTGSGAGTCNCSSPIKSNYMKNFGPRLGVAYQLTPKTVIRSSYGVMFTHGDAVGGLAYSLGTLGFSSALSAASSNSVSTMTNLQAGGSGAIPSYAAAGGAASGSGFGTGYANVPGYTKNPNGMSYDDPYLGSRAPEYINWSIGIQRQVTNALAVTATYVGSEGHFLQTDSLTGRGYWSNQLDPKYLALKSTLNDKGTAIATDCGNVALGLNCNPTAVALFANSAVNQPLSTFLKPFPFHSISDSFGYVGNANYNAIQIMANMRAWHGLTLNTNYTFSRSIDDGGTFRTGYDIPVGTIANYPSISLKADSIERGVSTSNQPQHFVLTAVWDWPFGKTILAQNAIEREILGGFKFSGIYQAYSGSPLAITASACQTNPSLAQSTSSCAPTRNPHFTGSARQNGKWGKGVSSNKSDPNYFTNVSFITPSIDTDPTAPLTGPFVNPVKSMLNTPVAPAYTFGDSPRTAPYNLYGPGNYQLDLAMVRTFQLHLTPDSKLNFRAEWYNVTNHTQFAVASTVLGNSSFGTVTQSPNYNRKAAQFSARIDF
jgi:hypothetical protein